MARSPRASWVNLKTLVFALGVIGHFEEAKDMI